jgi:signal transduction histidine kinase
LGTPQRQKAERSPLEAIGASLAALGDRTLLRRLVRNLVENARRYGGDGPVTVSVTQEGRRAVLDVTDHGPGVPEAERQRIFEPFYRLAGGAETGRGSGLGLALVLDIARRHGGDAVCLAAEGGGSRFRVDLPAV